MCVRACESENVFRWCAFFSALICLSLVVIVLAGLLSMCARVCTSSEVPELPSNITQGLCFDPPASPSPQPAPKHIVINVPVVRFQVGNTQMHTSLLSPQRFRFPHSLPHFQRQCAPPAHHLPVSVVWGACNGRGRLGSSPHLLCHQSSQSFTPLAAAPQPKAAAAFLYSTLERETLAPPLLWTLTGNLLLDSSGVQRSWRWMMYVLTANHSLCFNGFIIFSHTYH